MTTSPVFEIDGNLLRAKGATKHYLKTARCIVAREQLPDRIRDLEYAKHLIEKSQRDIADLSLGADAHEQLYANNHQSKSVLTREINESHERQGRLNDMYAEQIQAMQEAGVPWLNRFFEVRLREGDRHSHKNPYIDYSRSDDAMTGKVRFNDLAAELNKDLGRYLGPSDYKIVPAEEAETFNVDPISRTEVTGARVLFSEALEPSMPLVLAKIVKDRIMSHPDIGGTGKESWEALRKVGDGLDGASVISMLEYEFRTNHPENMLDYIATGLLFGNNLDDAVKDVQFNQARVHLIPAVVARNKDVIQAKSKHDEFPNLHAEKALEVAMLSAFVDHMEKKLQPEQHVDLPM